MGPIEFIRETFLQVPDRLAREIGRLHDELDDAKRERQVLASLHAQAVREAFIRGAVRGSLIGFSVASVAVYFLFR